MKKREYILTAALILAIGLSGCQKSPESSIVVNKDMDKLVEKAKDNENSSSMEDMRQYDSYQADLEDTSLGVQVKADAKVDIPETSQLSVIRVKQKQIDQEFLDKVRAEFLPGEKLYDGGVLSTIKKSDIEMQVAAYKTLLQDDEITDEEKNDYQSEIDALQEQYESAPTDMPWEENESDGKLINMTEKQEATDEFYSWAYSLNPNGQLYYGVNRGEDGEYISLYAQNNEERGNCLRYRRSIHGYEFVAFAIATSDDFTNPNSDRTWEVGTEPPLKFTGETTPDGKESGLVAYEGEEVTISQEKAISMANEFLSKMGLDEYQYYEGGLYNEVEDIRYGVDMSDNCQKYSPRYILRYMRNVDGAFVTFDSAMKHAEGWNGGEYMKKEWSVECVELRVTDEGIIGFDYNSPLEMMETVVEKSALKSFDEVKGIFEQMVMVANAQEDITKLDMKSIQIDRVRLGYVRVSEADSYDTGLLIPAWDFIGREISNKYGGYGSFLTVNAIDGSVIDRTLGY